MKSAHAYTMMLDRVRDNWVKRLSRHLLFPRTDTFPAGSRRKVNQWSIGIFSGNSPFEFSSSGGFIMPVLTYADVSDVRASLVADPFMLKADHHWHMFFEVMNTTTHKGEIGLAVSKDGFAWSYQQIVLAEPFHLSYPYVFEWMGDYYMIPETHKAGSVRLYRALDFPRQWSYVRTLLGGGHFGDASIFHYDDKWWLFAETNPERKNDTLRLYCSDNLMGAWQEHPRSPVIAGNPHIARPGGRVLVFDGRIIRYTQDCFPRYGTQVRAFEITELTTRSYREMEARENPILSASDGDAWNAAGMHHIDPHPISDNEWIACVDGHRKVWVPDSDAIPPE